MDTYIGSRSKAISVSIFIDMFALVWLFTKAYKIDSLVPCGECYWIKALLLVNLILLVFWVALNFVSYTKKEEDYKDTKLIPKRIFR